MSAFDLKYKGISDKYKYVRKILIRGKKTRWQANVKSTYFEVKSKTFDTEREAAIYVDKELIKMGREPVNILKREHKQ